MCDDRFDVLTFDIRRGDFAATAGQSVGTLFLEKEFTDELLSLVATPAVPAAATQGAGTPAPAQAAGQGAEGEASQWESDTDEVFAEWDLEELVGSRQ